MRTREDIAAWWISIPPRDRANILGIRYLGTKTRIPTFANLDGEQTLIVVRYCGQEGAPWQSQNPFETSPTV